MPEQPHLFQPKIAFAQLAGFFSARNAAQIPPLLTVITATNPSGNAYHRQPDIIMTKPSPHQGL